MRISSQIGPEFPLRQRSVGPGQVSFHSYELWSPPIQVNGYSGYESNICAAEVAWEDDEVRMEGETSSERYKGGRIREDDSVNGGSVKLHPYGSWSNHIEVDDHGGYRSGGEGIYEGERGRMADDESHSGGSVGLNPSGSLSDVIEADGHSGYGSVGEGVGDCCGGHEEGRENDLDYDGFITLHPYGSWSDPIQVSGCNGCGCVGSTSVGGGSGELGEEGGVRARGSEEGREKDSDCECHVDVPQSNSPQCFFPEVGGCISHTALCIPTHTLGLFGLLMVCGQCSVCLLLQMAVEVLRRHSGDQRAVVMHRDCLYMDMYSISTGNTTEVTQYIGSELYHWVAVFF